MEESGRVEGTDKSHTWHIDPLDATTNFLHADAHYNYGPAPHEVKERVRRIQQVCKAYKVKLPEAALHFPLGHPAVVSVAPGVHRASEARRNAQMMSAKIPSALWRALKSEKLIRADAPTPR